MQKKQTTGPMLDRAAEWPIAGVVFCDCMMHDCPPQPLIQWGCLLFDRCLLQSPGVDTSHLHVLNHPDSPGRAACCRTSTLCRRGRLTRHGICAPGTRRGACTRCTPCSGRRPCPVPAPRGTGCRRGSGRCCAPPHHRTGGIWSRSNAPCCTCSLHSFLQGGGYWSWPARRWAQGCKAQWTYCLQRQDMLPFDPRQTILSCTAALLQICIADVLPLCHLSGAADAACAESA